MRWQECSLFKRNGDGNGDGQDDEYGNDENGNGP